MAGTGTGPNVSWWGCALSRDCGLTLVHLARLLLSSTVLILRQSGCA